MSDISYLPLIEDMTWSYSRIECFDSCPYRWFMKYIKGYSESPMFYSSYGSFMHKLLEEFYTGKISKEEMKIKFLFDFKKEVSGNRPSEKIAESYIKQGIEFIENITPLPFEPVAVEKKVEFDIDGIPFVGFIDYLGRKDDGLYIVDHKSRDLKPRSKRKKPTQKDIELDDILRQLYVYSIAVRKEYGEYPKGLCINCFRNGTLIEEPFDPDKCVEAIRWVKTSISFIKNEEDFSPSVEFFKCRYLCGLADECCYSEMR